MHPDLAVVVGIGVAYPVRASPLHHAPIAPPVSGPLDHVVFGGGVDGAGTGAEGRRMDAKPLPRSGRVPIRVHDFWRFSRR
jgi:hypothetical protein